MKNIKHLLCALIAAAILYSCAPADGDHTGSEYMPDMGHSIAQEANVYTYYYLNTWDSASTVRLKDLAYPGLPAEGTVPRGYAGAYYAAQKGASVEQVMHQLSGANGVNDITVPLNGHVPYNYTDTEDERARATAELINNPFPITAEGLERGQELYDIFCGVCHGEKGDGVGYLVSEDNPNAVYPAAPANFLLDELVNSSNGRYYHAIMYGKNVMGGYADKLSYEERWQVIHWIKALQAKDKKLQYTADSNTFNPEFGTPMALFEPIAANVEEPTEPAEGEHEEGVEHEEEHHDDGEHHEDGEHGHDTDEHSGESHGKK